ncbi:hypothetical protein ACW7GZ_08910 [Luteimonas sp. A537]
MHRTRTDASRRFGRALAVAGFCSLLVACGAAPADGAAAGSSDGTAPAATVAPAPGGAAEPGFQATVTGDRELALEGANAMSGARYGRYHLGFSGQPGGGSGPVVISLARDDTASPAPGTYALGDDDDFDGNIEIHPGPVDYAIEDGELVISSASGDALTGRYAFSARERAGTASVTVEGSFQTRAVD